MTLRLAVLLLCATAALANTVETEALAELDLALFHTPSFLMTDLREGEELYQGPVVCKTTATETKPAGVVTDGSGGKDYANNLAACWRIQPPNTQGQRVKLTFGTVSIEKGYDFLRVYDLANNALIDGNVVEGGKTAYYSTVGFLIQFTTDKDTVFAGWDANYVVEKANTVTPEEVVVVRDVANNHKASFTTGYGSDGSLVVRRGVAFTVSMDPARIVPKQWRFGLLKSPKGSETLASITVDCKGANHADLTCVTSAPNKYTFTFGFNAPIGAWDMDAILENGKVAGDDNILYLLFNPYAAGDETFINDPNKANEYLRPTGAVFAADNPRPWNFGVGDMKVLKGSLHALRLLTLEERRRAYRVAREFSWKANDEILYGRWDGEYSDGKQPGYWQSSVDIIGAWYDTDNIVKYGQCWVFSATTNALSRSVGIPTRSVTNMGSAHEHPPFDNKCVSYWKKNAAGQYDRTGKDSIWNFHVWNEGWFTRPDLNDKNAGWNGFDGTCQEMSEGRCQMGPARLSTVYAASKTGALTLEKYDAGFLSSETNCDSIDAVWDEAQKKYIERPADKCAVGIHSWTLKPGTQKDKDDLAPFYKQEPAQCNGVRFAEKNSAFQYIPAVAATTAKVGSQIDFGVVVNLGPAHAGKSGKIFLTINAVDQPGTKVIQANVYHKKAVAVQLDGQGRAQLQDKIGNSPAFLAVLPKTRYFELLWSIDFGKIEEVHSARFELVVPSVKASAAPCQVGKTTSINVAWNNPLNAMSCKVKYALSEGRGVPSVPVNVARGAWNGVLPNVKCPKAGRITGQVTLSCPAIGEAAGEFTIDVAPQAGSPVSRAGRASESGLRKYGPERQQKPTTVGNGHGRARRRRTYAEPQRVAPQRVGGRGGANSPASASPTGSIAAQVDSMLRANPRA